MWDALVVVVRMALLVYIGMVLVLAGCQRGMIYYPTRMTESDAISFAATDGLAPWRDEDGMLIGWHSKYTLTDTDLLLVFHGNAGFAAHRGYVAHGFGTRFDVFIMEYPGYGARSGRPSENNFHEAATAALQQLRDVAGERRIFLGGESLGAGVAARLAGANPDAVSGLFLITPFDSLVNVARHHYPIFPVRWLMRDRYESARHLQHYRGPIALLLAENDEVVPAKFGQALYDRLDGPKRIWMQAGRSHNTLDLSPGRTWWDEVADFLMEHAL